MKNSEQLQNLEKLLKRKELIEGSYCPFTLELARRSFFEYRKIINKNPAFECQDVTLETFYKVHQLKTNLQKQ